MTYIDYANRYWRVARANFASNNSAFLYLFLLDYVNGLRWQQPFRCPTALITGTFHISKQQVINARQELVKFGLIIFKEGTSRQVPPVYYLTTGEEGESLPDLEKLPVGKSIGVKEENTVDKTVGETQYKDIDKDKNNKSHTQEGGHILIDCLEDYLLGNKEWFHNLITQLDLDEKGGKDYVHSFVEYLKKRGFKDKDGDDAYKHFANWVNKELAHRKTSRQEAPIVQKTSGYDPSFYANMEGW